MKFKEMIGEIDTLLEAGESLVLCKVVATDAAGLATGDTWLIRPDGRLEGSPVDKALAAFVADGARAALENGRPAVRVFEETELFFLPLAAPDSLVIAGAGHIAVPLADMAAQAGFRVTVIDDREEFATGANFPRAVEVKAAPFSEALSALRGGPSTYVVIITRGHLHDRESLEAIIDKPLAYKGMIGSRRRIKAVFELLAAGGVPRETLETIHSPIGLDIGALTPAEIAVSILAELVAVRRRGASPFSLSGKEARR